MTNYELNFRTLRLKIPFKTNKFVVGDIHTGVPELRKSSITCLLLKISTFFRIFASFVECLLNNLLSHICLLRFFKHNKQKISKTKFFQNVFIIALVESFFDKLFNG
jgi:hypothetical protein